MSNQELLQHLDGIPNFYEVLQFWKISVLNVVSEVLQFKIQ